MALSHNYITHGNPSKSLAAQYSLHNLLPVVAMTSKLLTILRELRDIILEHYVATDDGYAYNFLTNQLRKASGDRIDLSLSLTCRQLAYELRGLALRTNKAHFSTFFSEETRVPAEIFQAVTTYKSGIHYDLVKKVASRLLTPAMKLSVVQ